MAQLMNHTKAKYIDSLPSKDENIGFYKYINRWILWMYRDILMKILTKNITGPTMDQNSWNVGENSREMIDETIIYKLKLF